MNDFWARVLGLGGETGGFKIRHVFWAQPWPVWVIVLAVLAGMAWIGFFYRRDGSRPGIAAKALMGLLRLVAMALLLLLCFQPRLLSQRVETTQSIVAVLVDASKSMDLKDSWVDQRRKSDLVRA